MRKELAAFASKPAHLLALCAVAVALAVTALCTAAAPTQAYADDTSFDVKWDFTQTVNGDANTKATCASSPAGYELTYNVAGALAGVSTTDGLTVSDYRNNKYFIAAQATPTLAFNAQWTIKWEGSFTTPRNHVLASIEGGGGFDDNQWILYLVNGGDGGSYYVCLTPNTGENTKYRFSLINTDHQYDLASDTEWALTCLGNGTLVLTNNKGYYKTASSTAYQEKSFAFKNIFGKFSTSALNTTGTIKYFEVKSGNEYLCYNIADYKPSSDPTTWTYPTQENKIFAGWYEDSAYTTPCDSSKITGGAFAKFVDATQLNKLAFQLTAGTTASSTSTSLRMITGIDCLDYQGVGFYVDFPDRTTHEEASYGYSTKCYTSILADETPYTASSIFGTNCKYLVTFKFTGIPNASFSDRMKITPYWVTADGTTVKGTSSTKCVNDLLIS